MAMPTMAPTQTPTRNRKSIRPYHVVTVLFFLSGVGD
jgi:hypothetical protein